MPHSLIVTGTIGIDTVHTPTAKAERVLGGSAVYFAAAASFHAPVRLVAAAGDDLPDAFRKTIAHFAPIDARGLEIRKGSKTFAWGGKYRDDMIGRDTLFTHLGVLEEAPPPIPAPFADSTLVFLGNTHPAVQRGLLAALPERRLAVADTMDLWINIAKDELTSLIKSVDGLVLNNDEAEQFTGKRNIVTAARKILELGPTFVVVKKGEHGCTLVHRDGLAALPAYPIEHVVDPTGAGDSFAGGMMGFLAANAPADNPASFDHVRRALIAGTVTASFTVESFSLDSLAALSKPNLDQRLHHFASMLRV